MTFQKGHKLAAKKQPESPAPTTWGDTLAGIAATSETPAPASVPRLAEKKPRVPVGLRNPMSVNEKLDPNYNYRFVRGKNGRVQQFLEGGYEIVNGDVAIGDPNIAQASGMGSAFSIPSGDSEDRVYLMRIPKEYYEEDQAAKEARLKEVEEQLKSRPKEQGLEGEVKLNR